MLDLREAACALADGDLTMDALARRLGMAKPTLYRLATSKAQLIDTCLDAEAERFVDQVREAPPGRAFERILRAVDGYERDSPGGFRLLAERRAAGAELRLQRVEARLAELLPADRIAAAGLLAAAIAIVAATRRASEQLDAAAAADEVVAAVT